MKKYFCDRCGISLIDENGVVPHYDVKQPEWKHLGKKHEKFVCEMCINFSETIKAAVTYG